MKGLVLTHLGRREEGLELVKKGMRYDLTSHICWHVFGLIQKGEKNYEEALKSYTQALRFDKVRVSFLVLERLIGVQPHVAFHAPCSSVRVTPELRQSKPLEYIKTLFATLYAIYSLYDSF